MKKKPTVKYIHTIEYCPGHFDGDQIKYASQSRPIPLCGDLKQIKKERAASVKFRSKQKWFIPKYGHMRVIVQP